MSLKILLPKKQLEEQKLPKWLTCRQCGNEHLRLKPCWYCTQGNEEEPVKSLHYIKSGGEPWADSEKARGSLFMERKKLESEAI
jgi:hypothetical protein